MVTRITKNLALAAIGAGIVPPEAPISRFLELTHLKKLLRLLQINCVLDVGANRGQFAVELRRIGYRGRIVSFEPVEREFAILRNAFRNDPEWQGYQVALGNETAVVSMNVTVGNTVTSSLLKPAIDTKHLETEEVQVRRLDELFPEVVLGLDQPRILLKMDTQGFDLEVFKGAGERVRDVVALQSEISIRPAYHGMPHYMEAFSAYERAGYELFNLAVAVRDLDGGLKEVNALMRRASIPHGGLEWYGARAAA
jgi:FkbM family methyltransferase